MEKENDLLGSSSRNTDEQFWEQLREVFFTECTQEDSMDGVKIRTSMYPYHIFDWFKEKLLSPSGREWVSVETKLPEPQTLVMVYAPACDIIGSTLIGQYFDDTKTWTVYDFGDSKLNETVTHWCALPAPPESNTQDK